MFYDGITFDYDYISFCFRYWRLKYKYTQLALGEKLYVSQQFISQIENGLCKPDLVLFFDFLALFGLTVSDFLSPDNCSIG